MGNLNGACRYPQDGVPVSIRKRAPSPPTQLREERPGGLRTYGLRTKDTSEDHGRITSKLGTTDGRAPVTPRDYGTDPTFQLMEGGPGFEASWKQA